MAEYETRAAAYDPIEYWKSAAKNIQRQPSPDRNAKSKAKIAAESLKSKRRTAPKAAGRVTKQRKLNPASSPTLPLKAPSPVPAPNNTTPPTSISKEQKSLPYNPGEGLLSSKQLNESIEDFLKRLPPSTTSTNDIGPWIWTYNPSSPYRPLQEDQATLKTEGNRLLSNLIARRQDLEAKNPSSPAGTITRKLKPHITALQNDLFDLARRTNVISGKWMLFPYPDHVDKLWTIIATATFEGTLGICAKVATRDENEDANKPRLICVYNTNFEDKDEIRGVLKRLRELAVVKDGPEEGGRIVYYKPDVWTHLGITSGNEWKLKASLHGSRDADMR